MRLSRIASSCVLKIFKDGESKHLLCAPVPQLHHSQIIINTLVRFLLVHSPSLLRSLWMAVLPFSVLLLLSIWWSPQSSAPLRRWWWGCWRVSDSAQRSFAPRRPLRVPASSSSVDFQSCVWLSRLKSSLTWYAPSDNSWHLYSSPRSAPAFLYKQ